MSTEQHSALNAQHVAIVLIPFRAVIELPGHRHTHTTPNNSLMLLNGIEHSFYFVRDEYFFSFCCSRISNTISTWAHLIYYIRTTMPRRNFRYFQCSLLINRQNVWWIHLVSIKTYMTQNTRADNFVWRTNAKPTWQRAITKFSESFPKKVIWIDQNWGELVGFAWDL